MSAIAESGIGGIVCWRCKNSANSIEAIFCFECGNRLKSTKFTAYTAPVSVLSKQTEPLAVERHATSKSRFQDRKDKFPYETVTEVESEPLHVRVQGSDGIKDAFVDENNFMHEAVLQLRKAKMEKMSAQYKQFRLDMEQKSLLANLLEQQTSLIIEETLSSGLAGPSRAVETGRKEGYCSIPRGRRRDSKQGQKRHVSNYLDDVGSVTELYAQYLQRERELAGLSSAAVEPLVLPTSPNKQTAVDGVKVVVVDTMGDDSDAAPAGNVGDALGGGSWFWGGGTDPSERPSEPGE
jgi:hypothetical protein